MQTSLLNTREEYVTMMSEDVIVICRQDVETEHRQLLSRLQHIRRILGYPPLPTGKQERLHRAQPK